MMDSQDNLDKIFREKFEKFEPEPPSNGWHRIYKTLYINKKSSLFSGILYYAAAASLIFGIVTAYLIYTKHTDTDKKSEIVNKQTSPLQIVDTIKVSTKAKVALKSKQQEAPRKQSAVIPAEKKEINYISFKALNEAKLYTLPDSSKVWLNRNSEINFPENFKKYREVKLQGEAYFEVVKRQNIPFTVETGYSRIEVLGTSFLIKELNNGDRVYVVEGTVRFTQKNEEQTISPLTLTAGMQVSTGDIEAKEYTTKNFLSWKTKKIAFANTSIIEAAKIMEEYFNIEVEVESEVIADCRFTGTFESPEPEEILLMIKATSGISYKKKDQGYIISGKACK